MGARMSRRYCLHRQLWLKYFKVLETAKWDERRVLLTASTSRHAELKSETTSGLQVRAEEPAPQSHCAHACTSGS